MEYRPYHLFFTQDINLVDIWRVDLYKNRHMDQQSVQVYMIYKPKSKKVVPIDFGDKKGEKPEGRED